MEEKKKVEKRPLTIKQKIIRSVIVIAILVAVVVLVYYILVWTGAWEYVNSVEKMRQLILSLGFWGRLAFVVLQLLQVTFIPIPSPISTLAGVLIYGPLETALLSMAGIVLGSVIAFWIGRHFGKRVVTFMVGEESCAKWTKYLSNAKYTFFVMMLLPIFPDDVLCLVAGLTNMSWRFFVTTNLIARPIGIFMTCYLGSGRLIPYQGWGLVAWGFIVVFSLIMLYLSFRYRTQIERFLQKGLRTKKEKESLEPEKNTKSENTDKNLIEKQISVAEQKDENTTERNEIENENFGNTTPDESEIVKEKSARKKNKMSSKNIVGSDVTATAEVERKPRKNTAKKPSQKKEE